MTFIIGLSEAGWQNLPGVLMAVVALIGAINLFLTASANRKSDRAKIAADDAKTAALALKKVTDEQTVTLEGLDRKADYAAIQTNKIGSQTDGTLSDLRKQLDMLYQQQIQTFRETQQQLVDTWAKQHTSLQQSSSGVVTDGDTVGAVVKVVSEALHATPETSPKSD